jgi:fatty acid desaturase
MAAAPQSKQSYTLSGGLDGAMPLESEAIENRVEQTWYSPRIDRKVLRGFMQRSDGPALQNFGLWLALLAGSGTATVLAWGTWWLVPALLLYGTIWSSSDARWHECGHGTAFRTRWLNEVFYHLSSFMCLREGYLWRWSHARHHTHTYIVGRDPEIQVQRPAKLWPILLDYFYIMGGWGETKRIALHAAGIVTAGPRDFMPVNEQRKMILSSRIYMAVIGGSAVASIAILNPLPFLMIALPRFYGGWHHQLCGLTQHAGLDENVRDHRLNTRTVYIDPVSRFLYLNMNYHLEHHMLPAVPYHALPKLHEAIKDQCPPAYPSLLAAYREIIPTLIRQSRDGATFVRRPLPEAQKVAA